MQPLSSLLHQIGKVPLEECYAVRIVKGRSVIHRTSMIDFADIVSCLLQLHRKHIRHGEITAQNVLINSELRARLCMPRELRIVDKREWEMNELVLLFKLILSSDWQTTSDNSAFSYIASFTAESRNTTMWEKLTDFSIKDLLEKFLYLFWRGSGIGLVVAPKSRQDRCIFSPSDCRRKRIWFRSILWLE